MIEVHQHISCPLCRDAAHISIRRLGGFPVIACPKLGTGELRFFPLTGVALVGPGLGVDQRPEQEKSPEDVRAEIAALEQRKAAQEAERRKQEKEAAERARLAKLRKEVGEETA